MHQQERTRSVKVKGDAFQWHVLGSTACQQVLAFYDHARVGDTLKNVAMPDGHMWDYKFEGANSLTQWNPVFPERRPREGMIVYAAAEDPSGWRT